VGSRSSCVTLGRLSRYEDTILVSIRRMSRAIDLHSRALAREHQLTGPQLICLLELSRAGTMSASELARAVALSQPTVTGILDRLESRGVITRKRSEVDRRRREIRLTVAGEALVDDAPSPLQDRFRRRLGALPEGEQAMLDWVLRRVVEMMEAEDVDASPVLTTGPAGADAEHVQALLEDE